MHPTQNRQPAPRLQNNPRKDQLSAQRIVRLSAVSLSLLFAFWIFGSKGVTVEVSKSSASIPAIPSTAKAPFNNLLAHSEQLRIQTTSDLNRELFCNLKAALVIDNATGKPLYSQNAQEIRSIASISKLLTAITLLEMKYNSDTIVTITKQDGRRSSKSNLYIGDKVKASDLFKAALVGSDNRSARALARTFAGSYERFAELMNKTAKEIGMTQTHMSEPTGLNPENRSSALDCALLTNSALAYPEIVKASQTKSHRFSVINKRGKSRIRRVGTTNLLVYS
ncbi:D-alanyl-D-alanine carboxypeptidase, partial [bacterium AH-315-F03]|nr:D-alanyl-D-alanine carboxypeptidase [bacterium AH-315-F03]